MRTRIYYTKEHRDLIRDRGELMTKVQKRYLFLGDSYA